MRLSDMLSGLGGSRVLKDCEARGITYDSRKVEPGFVYVSVSGTRFDGQAFVPEALSRGAAGVIAEAEMAVPEGVGMGVVENARKALSWASANFYRHPSRELLVLGVTGTKGKTTTCHMLRDVLEAAGEKTGLISSMKYLVGDVEKPVDRTTPRSSDLHGFMREMVDVGCTAAVLEVSSHALALFRVSDVLFDVALLTNIGRDHLDFHLTEEDYVASKALLFGMLHDSPKVKTRALPSVSIINRDDEYYSRFASLAPTGLVTYGLSQDALIRAEDIQPDPKGTTFSLLFGRRKERVRLNMPGSFNVYNALSSAAAGFSLGIPVHSIVEGLEAARAVKGRAQIIDVAREFAVIVDFAHTPESLRSILTSSREVGKGRLIVVFGCNGDRDRTKRPIMGKIAGDLCDFVVMTTGNPRSEDEDAILDEVEAGIKQSPSASYVRIKDRRRAIYEAIKSAQPGDTVVIAGKGHETYQEFRDRRIPFDDAKVAEETILAVTAERGQRREK